MRRKKAVTLLVTAGLCAALAAGCGGSGKTNTTTAGKGNAAGEATGESQVFRFSFPSAVVGLNPIMNSSAPDNRSHNLMYESLVADRANEKNEAQIYPGAASSWEISEDGMTYTFHMREGAVWNDGVPVTARDFEYTFKKMADPAAGSTNAWLFDGVIENFSEALYSKGKTPEDIGVKSLDDMTLEIKLTHPAGYFPDLLDGAKPIRQDKYEEYGDSYGSTPEKTVVNGPFIIESWDQNTQMTLVRNESYWNADNIKLDKLEMKVLDGPTAAQAYMNGDLDVLIPTDANWINLLTQDGTSVIQKVTGDAPEFLTFNCSNPYFKNPKVRLAFSLAIDREAFVRDLRDGIDDPIYSMIPDYTKVNEKTYTELVGGENQLIQILQKQYPDPKALLIEGLKELGMDEDPSKVQVNYASRGTTELSKKMAEWLQQQWRETLGVTVGIDMMDWNIMWDKVDAGEYDIATGGWGPYYSEPSALLGVYEPDSGFFNSKKTSWTDGDSKRFGELLAEAKMCNDEQKKAELYLEAEKLLVGTGVIAPTYLPASTIFLKDYVKGYYATATSQTEYSSIYIEGK